MISIGGSVRPTAAMQQQPVSVVILNYNGREFLAGCLDGILPQLHAGCEVVLVDNASSDGSAEFVEENYPSVRVVRNSENLGFAQGNNIGVDASKNDLIVLVNNDVVVEDGWLGGLVAALEDPEVAIASSLVKTVGVPNLFYERNGTINLAGHNVMLAFEDPCDLFSCTGCSLIFRKSEFGHPFDGDYFAYAEDVYLGLRARFAGRKVRHTNESRLLHLGGGTARKQRSSFITFYQERNRLLNDLLFFDTWTRIRMWPVFVGNAFFKTAYGLLKNRKGLPGFLRAYWWLATHPRAIADKRRDLRAEFKVRDGDVLKWMSCRIVDSESTPARVLNSAAVLYCRIVGLKTLETWQSSEMLSAMRSGMARAWEDTVKPHSAH